MRSRGEGAAGPAFSGELPVIAWNGSNCRWTEPGAPFTRNKSPLAGYAFT